MDKELEEALALIIELCPEKMTSKQMSIIIINLLIHKNLAHYWPDIYSNVAEVVMSFDEATRKDAIHDANKFLEDIVNGV
tara:strand:+ start:381 stop:620 length:240 start_codon:yes stop_codon:yes gene_type:complete